MNVALFLLAVGADPLPNPVADAYAITFVVAGPKPVENKVPAAKADPVPTRTAKVPAPGYHVHRDAAGREWSHSDASKGDRAAHLSPFDGSGPYWNPVQTGVRIVNYPAIPDSSPPVTYTLPASSGGCPGGVCPTPSSSQSSGWYPGKLLFGGR